jgi:hypothetical protein
MGVPNEIAPICITNNGGVMKTLDRFEFVRIFRERLSLNRRTIGWRIPANRQPSTQASGVSSRR